MTYISELTVEVSDNFHDYIYANLSNVRIEHQFDKYESHGIHYVSETEISYNLMSVTDGNGFDVKVTKEMVADIESAIVSDHIDI